MKRSASSNVLVLAFSAILSLSTGISCNLLGIGASSLIPDLVRELPTSADNLVLSGSSASLSANDLGFQLYTEAEAPVPYDSGAGTGRILDIINAWADFSVTDIDG